MQIGAFVGLLSLGLEIAVLERAARTMDGSGSQAVLATFTARIFTVGLLMVALKLLGMPVDQAALALSYCATFLVYMVWLTWKTATAPIQYQPKLVRPTATPTRAIKVVRSGEVVR